MGAYLERVDALAAVWRCWADVGQRLPADAWELPSRCEGWTVTDLYAHHSFVPVVIAMAEPSSDGAASSMTAVDVLRGFNQPDGLAHQMAGTVKERAVEDARSVGREELVARFTDAAGRAVDALRAAEPSMGVPWPGVSGALRLGEAVRIILMEATVHLLDVVRAVGEEPAVPPPALRETVDLLADLADPVAFVEVATGRSEERVLPVLR